MVYIKYSYCGVLDLICADKVVSHITVPGCALPHKRGWFFHVEKEFMVNKYFMLWSIVFHCIICSNKDFIMGKREAVIWASGDVCELSNTISPLYMYKECSIIFVISVLKNYDWLRFIIQRRMNNGVFSVFQIYSFTTRVSIKC